MTEPTDHKAALNAWFDQWYGGVRRVADLVTLGIEQERRRSERIAVVPVWTSTV